MNKPNRKGHVFANGQLSGVLSEFREQGVDSYVFEYDQDYLQNGSPIGHAFPFSQTRYKFDVLPPFFENLISEGWLRTHQSSKARLDKQDSFGLLLANGKDLIGALTVIPAEV